MDRLTIIRLGVILWLMATIEPYCRAAFPESSCTNIHLIPKTEPVTLFPSTPVQNPSLQEDRLAVFCWVVRTPPSEQPRARLRFVENHPGEIHLEVVDLSSLLHEPLTSGAGHPNTLQAPVERLGLAAVLPIESNATFSIQLQSVAMDTGLVCRPSEHLCERGVSFCVDEDISCLCLWNPAAGCGVDKQFSGCQAVELENGTIFRDTTEVTSPLTDWTKSVLQASNCWVFTGPLGSSIEAKFAYYGGQVRVVALQPEVFGTVQPILDTGIVPNTILSRPSGLVVLVGLDSPDLTSAKVELTVGANSPKYKPCLTDEYVCSGPFYTLCYAEDVPCEHLRSALLAQPGVRSRERSAHDLHTCGPSSVFLNTTQTYTLVFPQGSPNSVDGSGTNSAVETNCTWWLRAELGTKIQIDFNRFQPYRKRPSVNLDIGLPDGSGELVEIVKTYKVLNEATRVMNASQVWIRLEADYETVLELNVTAVELVSCDGNDTFLCRSETECIEYSQVCDGYQDCGDKSDEFGCGPCSTDLMFCSDILDKCVPKGRICDGRRDCLNYYDELNCGYCGPSVIRLVPNSPVNLRSPPISPDSDWLNCVWLLQASDPHHRIVVRVLEYVLEANNYVTMGNGHDAGPYSSGTPIVSKNGGVLPKGMVVVPERDKAWVRFCVMKTEGDSRANHFTLEVTQVNYTVNCTDDEFACQYGLQCVPLSARCDVIRDCDDFSDELGCGECSSSEYHCGDGKCIDVSKICNYITECSGAVDEVDCCSICGPSVINITGGETVPVQLSVPAFYYYICGWRVFSDPGTFVYLDIVAADRADYHLLRIQDIQSAWALPLENYDNMAGTSVYILSNAASIQFYGVVKGSSKATYWEFLIRARSSLGNCSENQTWFEDHNVCLSALALCDGLASWLDFADEMECDTCGGFHIELSADYPVYLAADFDADTGQGAFAVYRGNRSALPSPTPVLPTAATSSAAQFDCVWWVTAPAGTRMEIAVTAYKHTSWSSQLRFYDGAVTLPADDPILEVKSADDFPVKTYFNGSTLWVLLVNEEYERLVTMEVELSAHRMQDCGMDQFQCPSDTACIDKASRCDGFSDCQVHGDELGCGGCAADMFECVPGGPCIPTSYICDGLEDCSGFNDEFNCNGAKSRINLTDSTIYSLDRRAINDESPWDISSPAGTRIVASLAHPTSCKLIFGDGPYTRYVNPSSGFRTIGSLDPVKINRTAYPFTVSSSGSNMWILSSDCFRVYQTNKGFWLQFQAFSEAECSAGLVLCRSGRTCIEASAHCDGNVDCPEYEDEVGCGECSHDEFRCPLGDKCVPVNSICDGVVDCEEASDEFSCGPCGDPYFNLTDNTPVTLTSPAWPHNYPDNVECPYLLHAAPGKRVMVSFLSFATEPSYDKLWIGNGLSPKDDVILLLSGNNFPASVASMDHTMYLLFSSDLVFTFPGFELRAEQVSPDQVSCEPGETLCDYKDFICASENNEEVCPNLECDSDAVTFLDDAIDFKSPGYPLPYPAGLYCRWDVPSRGPAPTTLFRILDFSTEAKQDVALVSGLTYPGGDAVEYALAGTTKIRAVLFNATVGLTVRFQTDSNIQLKGFHFQLMNVNITGWESDWCMSDGLSGFLCEEGACLVASAQCDGFLDCPDGEDENECAEVYCPSFYHCSRTNTCIVFQHVCDGTIDCVHGDDEIECDDKRCPANCSCKYVGGEFHVICLGEWGPEDVKDIARVTVALQLTGATNRSSIQLLPGLFKELKLLRSLSLPRNMLHMIPPGTFYGLENLTYLNISGNAITEIASATFKELQSLEALIITDVHKLRTVAKNAFIGLQNLKTLVLVRNISEDDPLDAENGAFSSLPASTKAVVDDYRLCCNLMRDIPGFDIGNCLTTQSQPPLNLCGSLMQNDGLRVCMWVLGISALFGNLGVIIWRLRHREGRPGKKIHSFLVGNLAVSDFIIGVYMLMIAAADLYYGEEYSAQATQWRASASCKAAGVLSVLSSEASVFFVTLISLDCLLCIVFPFSRLRLRDTSTNVAVILGWVAALCLSVVPTLVVDSNSDVYGLSDVCIGLPLTTKAAGVRLEPSDIDNPFGDADSLQIVSSTGQRPAWILSIVVFLGVNLCCFLFVLVSYIAIFVKVKRSVRKVKKNSHRDREIKMAVKMALIVGTDFACWMPVIILGILSQTGAVHVNAEVYSWIVVLVLPINSSLNPYLYTMYSSIMTRCSAPPTVEKPTNKIPKPQTASIETVNSFLSDSKQS